MVVTLVADIRFLRATAARWAELNYILDPGEPGFEKDTGRWKIGNDQRTPWNQLNYMDESPTAGVTFQDLDNHINSLTPHPVYDDGPSLELLYQNAKV